MQELSPGDTLVVTCTDPGVKNDIPAWCRINGHEIMSVEESGDDIIITIRAGEHGQ